MNEKNQNDLVQNLHKLMNEAGITASELALKTDIKRSTLYKILKGGTISPRGEILQKLAEVFSVSVEQLMGKINSLEPLISIPLLKLESVQDWLDEKTIEPISSLLVDATVGKRAFGLIMQGSSMLPSFPDGALLIFDPDVPYKDRGFVLAFIHANKQIIVKQLLLDSGIKYLKSVNPEFNDNNMVTLTEKDKILATLVQTKISYV